MAAEGTSVPLDQSFEAAALVGDVSATVRWGDGNESSANVSGTVETGQLRFRFDYSLDQSGLFATSAARAALQRAGQSVLQRLTDDLGAISPGGKREWVARFRHPSTGADSINPNTLTARIPVADNLQVQQNELVVFVGGRDLGSNRLGEAFTGTWAFPETGPLTSQERAQILAFRDTVEYRGETGASRSTPTDFGPWGGSISFDTSGRSWYFGRDVKNLPAGQSDFATTAAHELMHILGFGASPSWDALATASAFTGTASRSVYAGLGGTGNVPLEAEDHWGDQLETQFDEPTLMKEAVATGTRQLPTPLDFAALQDIGWQFQPATVRVTADHVYADNGNFQAMVVLQGGQFGELAETVDFSITNVRPDLVSPAPITATAGVSTPPLVWTISDPGYANAQADPPTDESFEYQIDWRDGSPVQTGQATVTRLGSAGVPTLASVSVTHQFAGEGTYPVRLSVTDDDGGTRSATVSVTVLPAVMELAASFDRSTYVENEGPDSIEMIIVRQSTRVDDLGVPLPLVISGGDGRIAFPTQATMPAGAESVRIRMTPVQDTLPQPMATLSFQVQAAGYTSGEASFLLLDDENPFQNHGSRFNVSGDLGNNGQPVVSALDALQVINALNQFGGELLLTGRPFSESDRFWDVNGDYRISALDALQVINRLNESDVTGASESAAEGVHEPTVFLPPDLQSRDREDASAQDAALLSLLDDSPADEPNLF